MFVCGECALGIALYFIPRLFMYQSDPPSSIMQESARSDLITVGVLPTRRDGKSKNIISIAPNNMCARWLSRYGDLTLNAFICVLQRVDTAIKHAPHHRASNSLLMRERRWRTCTSSLHITMRKLFVKKFNECGAR